MMPPRRITEKPLGNSQSTLPFTNMPPVSTNSNLSNEINGTDSVRGMEKALSKEGEEIRAERAKMQELKAEMKKLGAEMQRLEQEIVKKILQLECVWTVQKIGLME
ncbi:hypothetical protein QAD02_020904 [Eretmocerus hayati]|uniref:Uncharacterized protein n=1 Tax=Eretmocerus hayati TaxID=131215 RepID=A0ACC2PQ04_9HYME|nr:hypothetical protein QAD02_020904 [Eretmocerus hayati]